jgi:hypothetical protein
MFHLFFLIMICLPWTPTLNSISKGSFVVVGGSPWIQIRLGMVSENWTSLTFLCPDRVLVFLRNSGNYRGQPEACNSAFWVRLFLRIFALHTYHVIHAHSLLNVCFTERFILCCDYLPLPLLTSSCKSEIAA